VAIDGEIAFTYAVSEAALRRAIERAQARLRD